MLHETALDKCKEFAALHQLNYFTCTERKYIREDHTRFSVLVVLSITLPQKTNSVQVFSNSVHTEYQLCVHAPSNTVYTENQFFYVLLRSNLVHKESRGSGDSTKHSTCTSASRQKFNCNHGSDSSPHNRLSATRQTFPSQTHP